MIDIEQRLTPANYDISAILEKQPQTFKMEPLIVVEVIIAQPERHLVESQQSRNLCGSYRRDNCHALLIGPATTTGRSHPKTASQTTRARFVQALRRLAVVLCGAANYSKWV